MRDIYSEESGKKTSNRNMARFGKTTAVLLINQVIRKKLSPKQSDNVRD